MNLGHDCVYSHKMNFVGEHLFVNGIDQRYIDWMLYGEPFPIIKHVHDEIKDVYEDVQIEDGGHDYDKRYGANME